MYSFKLPSNIRDRYELIYNVFSSTGNIAETAKILQISENSVRNARNWVSNNRPDFKKNGRPTKITPNIKYFIAINTIFYPETSCETLASYIRNNFQIEISETTIRNERHKMQFKYGPKILRLPLNQISMLNRLNFCNWFFTSHLNHRNIIYSDESWFVLGPNNYYVWRLDGEFYNSVTQKSDAHPPKVMIWGGIGFNFKTDLIFFTKGVTSETYIKEAIVGSHLKYRADLAFGPQNWLLQEDNARPHTAIHTQNCLKKLKINTLPIWPPYSPDLSPIEIIWAIMKRRIEKYKPTNLQQLMQVISYVWNQLDYFTIDCLVDSFPIRLQKCIENNGDEVRFN